MALEHITDHVAQAQGRLAQQYRDSTSMKGVVQLIATEWQTLEDVFWSELATTIENEVGEQLDVLGRVVNQPREGRDDASYRVWIRARVRINRSGGTAPTLIDIFRTLAPAGATVRFEPQYPAGFVMRIGAQPVTNGPQLVEVLRAASAAGVKAILEYLNVAPAASFSFLNGGGLGFGAGIFASAKE